MYISPRKSAVPLAPPAVCVIYLKSTNLMILLRILYFHITAP